MASSSNRKIFVNVAVREVKRSIAFFTKLGFTFNPEFTDDKAACMVVNPDACVVLLCESFFRTFTKKEICNTGSHSEGLFALSCRSRAEVNELVNRAIAAGGSPAMDAMDRGFLYGWSFYDLDGHHWEVLWVKPTVAVS
ncbi:MAG TPA: VOC family protein [Bryobacteraceae bacterium]|nr:VOC family protein [Bryobacteraceae bacterium]